MASSSVGLRGKAGGQPGRIGDDDAGEERRAAKNPGKQSAHLRIAERGAQAGKAVIGAFGGELAHIALGQSGIVRDRRGYDPFGQRHS
jgi:hypothetical protein